jgi:hypothetical protein
MSKVEIRERPEEESILLKDSKTHKVYLVDPYKVAILLITRYIS